MDRVLCDELLQDIFTRLFQSSPSSSSSVSLVSKRWLHLYRASKTSLSLQLDPRTSTIPTLSVLLSHYPFISSLSLLVSSSSTSTTTNFNDQVLFVVSSSCFSYLKQLRFLAGPVRVSSLLALSRTCKNLTSLSISLSRPLSFNWVVSFSCLKELYVCVCGGDGIEEEFDWNRGYRLFPNQELEVELGLESLSLSGIRADDWGIGWLWRSCKRLKTLQLKSCEGICDGGSFVRCLKGLEEVELRTCRSIVDGVLLKLADNCDYLTSLLVYDGGSKEGLLQFISNCRSNLQNLDLRLPLDLDNDHLSSIAVNLRGLSTLRLQSCCLVTGEGLMTLGISMNSRLEELSLINCDVVEREPGLLATLGQNLKQLRKLDLSYNEMLLDKEFILMLISCSYLIELKLRGCRGLTGLTIQSILKSCKKLESIDIMHCGGIGAESVELFVMNSPRLRRVQVEETKLSDVARTWASNRFIEVVA
ncbi:F-box/LRR-repeat protein 3-like [Tripterygium wilfordii]|uniref:F-box/LRR-repeat protein 3-like n=1 Tax=Tripterygium wilfordii TaxID=458696 RepID=A0A7J7CZT4_TRIWF|nr:F-box/LRR-repeat protein 4 [Tripterygium wilfordii]KAF5739601.1 F-box/LRR-repeat protein 3-like [Tripterygium wilfordii]